MMADNEMVERVARAISFARGLDPEEIICPMAPQFIGHPRLGVTGAFLKPKDEHCFPAWSVFVPDAIAAIKAMREPTVDMLLTGFNAPDNFDSARADSIAEYAAGKLLPLWQAMIDASLANGRRA